MICLRFDHVRRFRGLATLPVLVVFCTEAVALLRLVKMGGLGIKAAAADDIW